MFKRKKMTDTLREMPDAQRRALASKIHQKIVQQYTAGRPTVGMDLLAQFQDALSLPENALSSVGHVMIGALEHDYESLPYIEERNTSAPVTWQPVALSEEAAVSEAVVSGGNTEESVEAA